MYQRITAMGWLLGVFSVCCLAATPGIAQVEDGQSPEREAERRLKNFVESLNALTIAEQVQPRLVELFEVTNREIQRADTEISRREDKLNQLNHALLFEFNVSEVAYPQLLMQLQLQRINLSIELAGLEAKAKELREVADRERPTGNAEQQARYQAMIEGLEEVLKLENEDLIRSISLKERGVGSDVMINQSRRKVLEAEMQLLQLQQTQADEVSPWLREALAKVALDQIEASAKLAKVEALLQPLKDLQTLIQELQTTRHEMEAWRSERAALQLRLGAFQDKVQAQAMGR